MGLFGKLKTILFEDDIDDVEEMPVYTKDEIQEEQVEPKVEPLKQEKVETPVVQQQPTRFKRDIDMSFDDDVLGEVPGAFNEVPAVKEEVKEPVVKQEVKQPVVEKKSIFPSFDEAEFERLNARINRNEAKASQQREIVGRIGVPVTEHKDVTARRANNNFSATKVITEPKEEDRFKINVKKTDSNVKKPFTPSPVISPVYGILDKNYTKDDIVDRKGGLKREKKPYVPKGKTIEEAEKDLEQDKVVKEEVITIDAVRKKAYGDEVELPKETQVEKVKVVEKVDEPIQEVKATKLSEEVYKEVEEDNKVEMEKEPKIEEATYEEVKEDNEPSIEEQIENEYFQPEDTNEISEDVVGNLPTRVEETAEEEEPTEKKSKVLDDLEKTSTLKILDDIEKELNSIKPISKEAEEEENKDVEEHEKSLDDTLENDLFNLIDSMYEEGDEDDD